MNRLRGPFSLVALLVILSCPWAETRAGGFTIIEFGGGKTGMMTSVANPEDLSAVYHSPAALADLHGTRMHLSCGFSLLDITARAATWDSGEGYLGSDIIMPELDDGSSDYFPKNIHAKTVAPIPMFVMSTDFGFERGPVLALSAYVPNAIGATLPESAPTRYMVTDALFVAGMASLTGSYRLPDAYDWLALGASVGLMYTRLQGQRWHNQPTLLQESADYIIALKGEDYAAFFNFGILVNPIPDLAIGLVYIMGNKLELKGDLKFKLPPGVEEEDPLIASLGGLAGTYHQNTHMTVPHGLAAGISWQAMAELELAADLRYWFYRTFKNQDMYHDIDLELMGQPAVDNPLRTPKLYKDSWTLSVGARFNPRPDWLPVDFMVGGSYDQSPAPSKTKSLDSPTVDLAGFSLGAQLTVSRFSKLVLTYYRYWYLKDTITDSILVPPQNAQFWGTVDTVSVQLEFSLDGRYQHTLWDLF